MALADSLKLRNYLRTLSNSKLVGVSEHWNISIESARRARSNVLEAAEIADYLYPRMVSDQYFPQAFEKLNKAESETVQFIAVQGCTLAVSELAERLFRGNIKSATNCVLSLEKKGFAFLDIERPGMLPKDDRWVVVPEAYLRNLDFPPHWQGFLGNLLRTLDKDILHSIVRRILPEIRPEESTNVDMRYELRQRLLEPGFIESLVSSLSSSESQLFHILLERKGTGLYRDLLDITNTRKLDHSRAEELNNLILTSGLIFTVAEGHNKYMNSLVVPRDIFYTISRRYQKDMRSLQRIDSTGVKKRDIKPVTVTDNTSQLLRDLTVLSARIDIGKVKKLTSGGINRSDLKRVTSVFPSSKLPRYLHFLSLSLIETEQFVEVDGSWVAGDDFLPLAADPDKLYEALVQWWLRTTQWNELYVDGLVPPGEKPPQLWINVVELRREVLRYLQQGSKDRWMTFSGFWEAASPQLEANLSRGIGGGGYGGILTAKEAVAVQLKESFTWLGLVQHGYPDQSPVSPRRASGKNLDDDSAEESDFSFQLTDLGRQVCDSLFASQAGALNLSQYKNKPVSLYGSDWIIVQPNLEVVSPPDLRLDKLFNLVRMSELKNIDVMTTLEITRDSLRAIVERGATEDELKQLLKSLSRSEIPATVNQLIEECTARHGEVRVGACGGYIMADEPLLIESIFRNSKTSAFVKEKPSENLLLLADDIDLNKVARELRNQGHMPKMEDGGVHMTSDGRYHLNLNEMEMQDVVAAVRFLNFVELYFESDFTDNRSASLLHRLRQGGTGIMSAESGTEVRFKQIQKKFESAVEGLTERIEDKYRNQVTKLVSRSNTSRGASKYQFKGTNPAVERHEIVELLQFALDFDLEVEIIYIKQNDQEVKITVHPKGIEGERIYAHNPMTDVDAIYSLSKILKAKLI